jgi:uridylate kinase
MTLCNDINLYASLYLYTGDDMGMGKTVMIAALLLAIFGKTGTELDLQVH